MRSILLSICVILTMCTTANSQQRTPTLEELIPGGANYKFAENLYGLKWWGDVCIKPEIDSLFTVDPKTGKETFLFDRETLNKALAVFEGSSGNQPHKLSHLYNLEFPWAGKNEALITARNHYYFYDFRENTVKEALSKSADAQNEDYSPEANRLAYTIGNNLYVNGTAVTNEPEGVVCGQSVHRNEFGITKGTFWSPKGNLLAFYRMDERMVTNYPLVDITTRIAEVNNVRYPMAGMTSHQVTVGVYNPTANRTVYLNTGDPTDRYFTNISWSPDEKSIYLIELNRDQNHAKLCRYNAETGEPDQILFEETHPKYVEPQHPVVFLPWDDKKFIYQSQKDGFNHLYLYDTSGKLIKQLTSGEWLVQDILGFNEKKKEVIIASTEYSPLQTNIFRVNTSNGKRSLIGVADGVHDGFLSESGNYFIDYYSAPNVPRSINVIDIQKGKTHNLLTAEDPFKDYKMPAVETGTIKAADGVTDLYYRLIKPVDFDENKKYPVIVYVYGGPHAQMIRDNWQHSARGWDIYMATKGYLMFTVDNRGSSNRGLEFENVTFRNLGIEECKDQLQAVSFLKTLPYADTERLGVHGWSYGGHMTTALMLRYPDVYKVGVAGGPVIDWKYYEIMYGERYMDTPQTNREGYDRTNLNTLAGNLKGHLLMIHDDHDDTCVPQHTLSFMKACVDARTYPDLFIYLGHKHNVMGRDRVHLHEKITRYFETYLK